VFFLYIFFFLCFCFLQFPVVPHIYFPTFLSNLKKPKLSSSYFPFGHGFKICKGLYFPFTSEGERGYWQHQIKGYPNVIGCFEDEITIERNGEMVYKLLMKYDSGGSACQFNWEIWSLWVARNSDWEGTWASLWYLGFGMCCVRCLLGFFPYC
jgi:hypothetical protein